MKTDIRDLTREELAERIALMGEPAHRVRQIFGWLYGKGVSGFDAMTDLPKGLIHSLDREYYVGDLECEERLVSRDGTEKFLWKLMDGEYVESVLIKGSSGRSRATLCLSTQAGCRYKCPFCASGQKKFVRNLSPSEITGQVVAVQRILRARVSNIVFMGMGEPLDNYDNLVRAIKVMNAPDGLGIGARKITVSTCGLAPEIKKLKDLGLQIELSVSLHATENAQRDKLVPVNRKYPLERLTEAIREYYEGTGRVVTLEYTVIEGVNDTREDAERLAAMAKKLKAKINLIACSPACGKDFTGPPHEKVVSFKEKVSALGAAVTVRRSKGDDIMAACGQLAARKRHEI